MIGERKPLMKTMKTMAAALIVGTLLGCTTKTEGATATPKLTAVKTTKKRTLADLSKSTVMITNMAGNSGGSGVVILSSKTQSEVLTNAHVCAILEKGGKVVTEAGKSYLATGYQKSEDHDLCLIAVAAELGNAAKVGTTSPKAMDTSVVIGHPALLPTTVTNGHFGETVIVEVFTGLEPCTGEEKSQEEMLLCMFFGGKPVIKNYNATYSSSTIMPGSSGSAVYNGTGEVVGLVFAGRGGLGYAYTVPFSYLKEFVKENSGKGGLYFTPLENRVNLFQKADQENFRGRLKQKCLDSMNLVMPVSRYCKIITDTVL